MDAADSNVYDNLVKAESNLADIRRDVADHQAKLSKLQQLEREYWLEVETQRQIVRSRCSIGKLSDEVLANIFLYLTDGFDPNYPWTLEFVCKRWRNACLDNPSLWSRIQLSAGHQCGETSGRQADSYDPTTVSRTMLQLERSKSAQLFIRLDRLCQCPSQMSRFMVVARHSSRWRTVEVDGTPIGDRSTADSVEALWKLIPAKSIFKELRKIQWTGATRGTDIDDRHGTPNFPFVEPGTLSNLTEVHMEKVTNLTTSLSEQLPWSQLTSLHLALYSDAAVRDNRGQRLLAILSRCLNLKTSNILVYHNPSPDANDDSSSIVMADVDSTLPISLPHVTKVILWDATDTENALINIIPFITLPMLSSLQVGILQSSEHIAGLVQRSSCANSLKKLVFEGAGAHGTVLLPLLQECPNLAILSWAFDKTKQVSHSAADITSNNELLQKMTLREGFDPLCPHLKRLRLYGVKFEAVLMMEFVDSRLGVRRSSAECDTSIDGLETLYVAYPTVLHEESESDNDHEYLLCKTVLDRRYKGSDRLDFRFYPYILK